jgi:hypothetical protein
MKTGVGNSAAYGSDIEEKICSTIKVNISHINMEFPPLVTVFSIIFSLNLSFNECWSGGKAAF